MVSTSLSTCPRAIANFRAKTDEKVTIVTLEKVLKTHEGHKFQSFWKQTITKVRMPLSWRSDAVPMHLLPDVVLIQGPKRPGSFCYFCYLSDVCQLLSFTRSNCQFLAFLGFEVYAVEGNSWAAERAARLTPDAVQARHVNQPVVETR